MQIRLRPLPGNLRGPVQTESLLRVWRQVIGPQRTRRSQREELSLMIGSFDGEVGLAIECADELRNVIVPELQDAYPGMEVVVRQEEGDADDRVFRSLALTLHPDVYLLRTYDTFVDEPERELADPIGGLLSAVRTGRSGRIAYSIRLRIAPASTRQVRRHRRITDRLNRGFRSDHWRRQYAHWACDHRLSRRCFGWFIGRLTGTAMSSHSKWPLKEVEGLFACQLVVECRAPADAAQIASKRVLEMAAAFGRYSTNECRFITTDHTDGHGSRWRGLPQRSQRTRRFLRWMSSLRTLRPPRFLLTTQEVATLWHPPVVSADSVSRRSISTFREIEPPLRLASKEGIGGVTLLGRVKYRRERQQFGISADDLRRHFLAIGKTGSGKSTFLQNIIIQQMQQGRGVIVIDPHGQLIEDVLDHIPRRRTNDVILFDAVDRRYPVPFNPLQGPPGSDPTLVADSVLTALKKVFGFDEATAPRLLHIFRHCLLTLVGRPDTTLLSVQRLLVDAGFRKAMIADIRNEAVREFWLSEFNRWNERQRTEYVASLQNKLGAFTSNARLQSILCSTEEGINLRKVLDDSQILLCNLSKGTMGHDASTLLGSLLLSSLQLAAMSRADIPESERPDASVIVDEFHSFLSEGNSTMADALAESRKYRTSYILATQMLDQLDEATLAGVLGNCGSLLSMTVGPRDAETLVPLLGQGLTPTDLMQIPKYHGYIRLLTDGTPHTFSMTTLPPPSRIQRRADIVRRVSRQRFGQSLTNMA
ncbi:MAG: ATP-binding protein [Planctomycetaceae bacterium]|nr:ATP-binding protein [Planctomycetaceae bacterium]